MTQDGYEIKGFALAQLELFVAWGFDVIHRNGRAYVCRAEKE